MQRRSGCITQRNGLLTVEEVSRAFKWDIKQLFFATVARVNQQNGCVTFINGMIWEYKSSPRVAPDWLGSHVFCWLYITIIKQCFTIKLAPQVLGWDLLQGSINMSRGKLLMWLIWNRGKVLIATKWWVYTVNTWAWVNHYHDQSKPACVNNSALNINSCLH